MSRHPEHVQYVRLDKWLWSVRAFKTRSLAAVACDAGHVSINGTSSKPAKSVRVGDHVMIRQQGGHRVLRVLTPLNSRVGAGKVSEHAEVIEVVRRMVHGAPVGRDAPREKRPEGRDRRRIRQLFEED